MYLKWNSSYLQTLRWCFIICKIVKLLSNSRPKRVPFGTPERNSKELLMLFILTHFFFCLNRNKKVLMNSYLLLKNVVWGWINRELCNQKFLKGLLVRLQQCFFSKGFVSSRHLIKIDLRYTDKKSDKCKCLEFIM